ncbi:MAG: hypothetical protein LLG15_11200 [Betaproteobacteria bacterium]|nr:hypothetical protein [Betaproteobacteria bacterium]
MKFKNPANGHTEDCSAPWLWVLFFGALYLLVAGLWAHVIIYLLIGIVSFASMGPPATVIMILVNLIYAMFAGQIVRNSYMRKGWIEVTHKPITSTSTSISTSESISSAPENKKCPFCAELVKAEAIKCKHCGSELPLIEVKPVEDDDVMEKYGITFDGAYHFGEYQYSKLEDAIRYAKKHR